MTRLAHVPELMPTETLDGFLSRLAAANGAPSSYVFRKHMGIRLDKSLDDERILTSLSSLTGLSTATLTSVHFRRRPNAVSFGKHHLAPPLTHLSTPRYCPLCVEQDIATGSGRPEARPWIRAGWLVTQNEVCVEHRTKFFTSPTPYAKSHRLDLPYYLRNCRREFEAALADCETCEVHAYDRYFFNRLRDAHEPVELIDPLPYYIASRLCTILGRMARYGDSFERRSEPLANVDDARRLGFELLDDKSKLLGFLSELNANYLERKGTTRGFALYGDLQDYLTKNLGVPELGPLVAMVREHAMAALPIGPEDAFIGGGGVRRVHSINSARRETGMHSDLLRKILLERGVIQHIDLKMPDNKILCGVPDIDAAVADYRDRVDVQQIFVMLGTSSATVMNIVKKGILQPIFGNEKGMQPKFSKKAVERLLDNLFENAEERDEGDAVVSLQYAFARAGCQIADIVQALVDGRVVARYLSKDPTKVGLSRILVDLAEVKTVFASRCQGLKRHEFCRATGNDHEASTALMYSGFFQIVQAESRGNRHTHDVVTKESFDAFFDKHANLAELAEGWMKPWQVRQALRKANIDPVWALRHRRAYTFYRRVDVETYRLNNP